MCVCVRWPWSVSKVYKGKLGINQGPQVQLGMQCEYRKEDIWQFWRFQKEKKLPRRKTSFLLNLP